MAWDELTSEQRELRDLVRTLARERIAPRAAEIDEKAEYPWDIRKVLAEQDILGLPFPTEYGGTGTGTLMLQMAVEEIAKAKMADLNARDMAAAMKIIEGTARQSGITISIDDVKTPPAAGDSDDGVMVAKPYDAIRLRCPHSSDCAALVSTCVACLCMKDLKHLRLSFCRMRKESPLG